MDKKYRGYYYKRGESSQPADWRWRNLMAGTSVLAKALLLKQLGGDYIVAKMVRWSR